jgi:hypothetical protein
MKTRIAGYLPLLAACFAGAAHAAATPTILTTPGGIATEPNYLTLGLSGEHSDNVTRVETNPESSWITGGVTDFNWSAGNHPRFAANVSGTGGYYHYQNNAFDPEFLGIANGTLAYQLMPSTLTLLADDSLTQTRINEFAPLTPTNLQNVNRFIVGPELSLHPGGAQNLLMAQALYERTDYQDSPLDSDTARGQLSFGRSLDAHNVVNLTAAARQVKFSGDQSFSDYNGQDYFLSWVATGIRTTLLLDAGYSTTHVDGSDRNDSPLFRLNIARQVSPRSTAYLYASHTLMGAADAIFLDSSLGGRDPGASSYANTSEPFEMDYLGAGYALDNGKLALELRGSLGRERYPQTDIDDRNDQRIDADLTYRFNSWLGAGAFAEYRWETFVNRNDSYSNDRYFGVFVGFALGSRLGLNLSALRAERSTDLGPLLSYDETRARAILTYTIVGTGQDAPTTMPRWAR